MPRIMRLTLVTLVLLACTAPGLRAQPENWSAPDRAWFTIDTKHFRVHFHEGAERTARAAAKIAEEVYGPITSLYGHEPDSRVDLIMKDLSDYSNGAAYFFNNKIELWASPLDFELRGTHNWLRNVISHEFTHIIQMQASMKFGRLFPAVTLQWFGYERERRSDVLFGFPNLLISYPIPSAVVPPWMAEGTAQYMRREFGYESWDAHRDMILRSYVLADSMLTWQDMQAFGKTSLGNESVYNAGYAFVRYIAKTHGEQAVVDLTRALSKAFVFTADGAFSSVLGRSGAAVYADWKAAITAEYRERMAPVLAHQVRGRIIAPTGFANLFPQFTPDGRGVIFSSNGTSDYFGQSSIIRHDLATGRDTTLVDRVHSALSWMRDGRTIVFSRYNSPTAHGELYYDLYAFNLDTREERQLTEGLRAKNPACSPDGRWIAFASAQDGSMNIGIVDSTGANRRMLTTFTYGEQVFTPQWSPDSRFVIFGLSTRAGRSIARVPMDGGPMEILIGGEDEDCRDGRYASDGRTILYASNRTGIFNIYRHDPATGETTQLTNVTGGAFMPADNARGELVYAEYTASGYKIAVLEPEQRVPPTNASYLPAPAFSAAPVSSPAAANWDWEMLRGFDDTKLPEMKARPYTRVFQQMMIFPTLRIDAYNPENSGLQLFKPGLMFASSDILNRMEMLASASINTRGERDLYLTFVYRDRVPLFSALGLFPEVTLEVFNVTRKAGSLLTFPLDTIPVDVGYNLLEFAGRFKHPLFNDESSLEVGYRHSRYTSTLGSFHFPETGQLVGARDNLYLIGNEISAVFKTHNLVPARDGAINPVGYRFSLRYDLSMNRFNPEGDYDIDPSTGMLVPRYKDFNFHRIESQLFTSMRLPYWSHALSMRVRYGTILGPEVDEFFSFYAGGITGMQGYTYYALGGNEVAAVTMTYRFPIVSSLGFKLGHILFDKLYGGVFFDAGDAVASPARYALKSLKKDIGFELRLESFSFSMYPTRIFFSGAYGLDQFTRTFNQKPVTYGHEWRWYFGMLFDFDLSDGI